MSAGAGGPSTGRLVAVFLVGVLVSVGGVVWLERGGGSGPAHAHDNPVFDAAPSTTTSSGGGAAPPVSPSTAVGRAEVPEDPYAHEPVQEIGTIEIPKIGLVHRVYHGITLRNIDRGPSHWPGTAMPGETGNTVFAGHRVTHSAPFRRIHELVPGDRVVFTVAGVRSVYTVTGHQIVTPRAVHIADPTPTPTGTLFACHPPGSARLRYVVRLALLADG